MSWPGLTQSSCHHNLSLVNMSQILTHCNFSYLQHISFKNCLFIQYIIMYPAPWQTRLQWGQQTCSPVRVTEGQNDVQVLLWQPRLSLGWWSSVLIHLDSNSSQLFINIKMDSWTAITFQHEGHLNYWKKNVFDVKRIVFITCTQIAFRSNVFFNGKWQLFHLIHV